MNLPPFDVSWDPSKAQTNIAKHGVTFAQAATVLLDPLALTVFDAEHSGDTEDRWFTLGMSSNRRLLAVSHTYDDDDPGVIHVRIISARNAEPPERAQYESGSY